jgi:photosystem II stability/assembly factor-like uncharacterized protein
MGTSRMLALRLAAAAVLLQPAVFSAAPQGGPSLERVWGGETRQVFTLEDGAGNRHVWTVGDGPLIRHALNPTASTSWTVQAPPSGVTQNLLDVHFIRGTVPSGPEHVGFACGVNGHVLKTVDYGTTWTHLDSGEVQNQLPGVTENAVLWRNRFTTENNGFACGLWTFKRWNGPTTGWTDVQLLDQFNQPLGADTIEFYALELLVDPNNPGRWIGVAAGQRWGSPGGGHGDTGSVFYGSFAVGGGNTWKEVFRTDVSGHPYQDPWDLEFAANPAALGSSVGYLCVGTGSADGAIFRTNNGGLTWNPTPELTGASTLYGIGVVDADHAVAAGYAGEIWVRDASGWTCRRGSTCTLPPGVTETQSAPLAGVHAEGQDVYVTGSWGYVHVSSDGFLTDSVDLEPASSDAKSEHWRFLDLDFTSATRGYAVSANKTIIDSQSGGTQWDLSPSSPNGLLGPGSTTPLTAVDFRTGGGSGVAVGWGETGSLATFTAPALSQSFAYFAHETSNPSWVAGQISFQVPRKWLLLQDVAWASGDGATAEFWAAGSYGDGDPYAPTNRLPALLRSTDGGATWSDGDALTGSVLPASVRLNALAFRNATQGFLVGYDAAVGSSVAYRIDLTGGPALVPLAIPVGATNEIVDVAANDSFVAAVGQRETLFSYQATPVEQLVLVTGLPSLGFAVPTNFMSIAMPPGLDPRVLIGMAGSIEEGNAPGIGKVLYFNGGWSVRPAATNKNLHALVLRTLGGFAIAGGGANSEVGMVGDSAILRFNN